MGDLKKKSRMKDVDIRKKKLIDTNINKFELFYVV